jgi:hypothetical protein
MAFKAKDYRRLAAECLQLAEQMRNPEAKRRMPTALPNKSLQSRGGERKMQMPRQF